MWQDHPPPGHDLKPENVRSLNDGTGTPGAAGEANVTMFVCDDGELTNSARI